MENQEKEKKWYYDDSIILLLAFLAVFILYAIGVALFISKGDEKTLGAFEAITGISGLILSFGTVYYVVKTYKAQQQQIIMQEKQIRIQQDEILANKKDVEFNRTLDIIYKQLEYTNIVFKPIADEYYSSLKEVATLEEIFDNAAQYNWIFLLMIEQFNFYDLIINKDIFHKPDIQILNKIVYSSVNQKIIHLYNKFTMAVVFEHDTDELKKKYSEFINKQYITDKRAEVDDLIHDLDEEKKEALILEKYNIEIEEYNEYFGFMWDKFNILSKLINNLKNRQYK
ncbi:hypothetical protein [Sphingobacterium sp.]|uniref:hypothetical protein n=1 Tax=Sphingobacterium sp. TaxID=341027 RepID=UPI00289AA806|nr:hypothetical protein [Sphingobacterium sp.]